jgi:hypothetical protein
LTLKLDLPDVATVDDAGPDAVVGVTDCAGYLPFGFWLFDWAVVAGCGATGPRRHGEPATWIFHGDNNGSMGGSGGGV